VVLQEFGQDYGTLRNDFSIAEQKKILIIFEHSQLLQ